MPKFWAENDCNAQSSHQPACSTLSLKFSVCVNEIGQMQIKKCKNKQAIRLYLNIEPLVTHLESRTEATIQETTHQTKLENNGSWFHEPFPQFQISICKLNSVKQCLLTLASVTLNSLRMYWGMLYSAIGSTTKYWYLADLSAGQYWWHFSYSEGKIEYHNEPQHSLHTQEIIVFIPRIL